MEKKLDKFEQGLRDKIQHFEMPYSHKEWVGMEASLGIRSIAWTKYVVIAAVATSVGVAIYSLSQNSEKIACSKAEDQKRFEEAFPIFNSHALYQAPSSMEEALEVGAAELEHASSFLSSASGSAQDQTILESPDHNPLATSASNPQNAIAQSIHPSNVIGLASNTRKACMGEEVLFSMTNGPKGGSYLWNFGDGHFSDESNPKHRFTKAGQYDVSLSITADDGQINTTVMSDMITIAESPDAYFFWEFADGLPGEPMVIIREESSGAETYRWTLPDGSETSEREPGKLKLQNGNNRVILKASNRNGCFTEVDRTILVKENSDPHTIRSGEAFMPQFLKRNKGRFVLSIFDTAGNQVYETSNRTKGWDGKIHHSRAAGSTFLWKAILSGERSDEPQYIFGTFNIQP